MFVSDELRRASLPLLNYWDQLVLVFSSCFNSMTLIAPRSFDLVSLADFVGLSSQEINFSSLGVELIADDLYTAPTLPFLSWGSLKGGSTFSLLSNFSLAPRSYSMGFVAEQPDSRWVSEFVDSLRFDLAGSFSGSFNMAQALNLVSPQTPSLTSFFLKLDALQD